DYYCWLYYSGAWVF
nr:immunoglobulin light chain junction region [Macaca mulatta]MOV95468.1 immunoglobulin light chain junction region [Macaca mulatta]MOV95556.1 immunoglobulin light chain junction region [Macaca mulatta]MOV97334.1 immunoglobulin light chain junction region [Macaca mulatta]MOV99407.1 immunoglobulin light chain junction region [Macaca mulatta]